MVFILIPKYISFFVCPAASRIRYEITSGNIGGAFAVKNMTGAIYVAGALDYETRKRVSKCVLILQNFTVFTVGFTDEFHTNNRYIFIF